MPGVRLEGGLFDLGVEIGDVAVQRQLAHFDQRIVSVRPDLGKVERVVPVLVDIALRHDLDGEFPLREIALSIDSNRSR